MHMCVHACKIMCAYIQKNGKDIVHDCVNSKCPTVAIAMSSIARRNSLIPFVASSETAIDMQYINCLPNLR